jgi:hypothetical protein
VEAIRLETSGSVAYRTGVRWLRVLQEPRGALQSRYYFIHGFELPLLASEIFPDIRRRVVCSALAVDVLAAQRKKEEDER